MPSIQAWFWYYALSVITYRSRRLTIEEELDKIAKHQAQANAPQQLPAACRSDPNVTTEESTFIDSNSGNQWQMFEFSPTVQKARKVILHFHGGGWVGEVSLRSHPPLIKPSLTSWSTWSHFGTHSDSELASYSPIGHWHLRLARANLPSQPSNYFFRSRRTLNTRIWTYV
jgi:hypothetical protein